MEILYPNPPGPGGARTGQVRDSGQLTTESIHYRGDATEHYLVLGMLITRMILIKVLCLSAQCDVYPNPPGPGARTRDKDHGHKLHNLRMI